jgi:hypothetical protein
LEYGGTTSVSGRRRRVAASSYLCESQSTGVHRHSRGQRQSGRRDGVRATVQ